MFIFVKNLNDMRELFESGKITEVLLYCKNGKDVKIKLLKSGCFDIRQFDDEMGYWVACFETSSKADWESTMNLAKSLIKEKL